ncbi:MAG TPA: hypothetical protein VGD43_02315, partial [Micromonospora sp.]
MSRARSDERDVIRTNREPVRGGGVLLRLFHPADRDDLATACADPAVQRFIPGMPDPFTRAEATWWITKGSVAAWDSGG